MKALNINEILSAVNGTLLSGDGSLLITSVTTNSKDKNENSLFVPIVGERVDAHDYIKDAKENGAVACFVSREVELLDGITYIKVDNTLDALQAFGFYYRNQFHIPIIGITGSVGKTTTKEMVYSALATKYNVLKTIGNMNSQVGLPLMMFHLEEEHEIAVIEMGISEFGEMERLAKVAAPTSAIMTNIGVSHIAQLKTRENIRMEKANIINEFSSSSLLYVCGDDDMLIDLVSSKVEKSNNDTECSNINDKILLSELTKYKLEDSKVISYGLAPSCDIKAENIISKDGKTYFTAILNTGSDQIKEEIVLNVLGNHNVSNALVALAIAKQYDIPMEVAKAGLEVYSPIAMRGQIKSKNGITFIDDSYNASPDSMKSGIQVLLSLAGVKRRVAVLADVRELGEVSEECHYGVGTYIAPLNVDVVITIGTEAKYIAKGITENKTNTILCKSFDNNEQAIEFLQELLIPGDGVLVKGSRGMATEVIIHAFCGN